MDFRSYLCQGIICTLLRNKDEAEKKSEQFEKLVPKNHLKKTPEVTKSGNTVRNLSSCYDSRSWSYVACPISCEEDLDQRYILSQDFNCYMFAKGPVFEVTPSILAGIVSGLNAITETFTGNIAEAASPRQTSKLKCSFQMESRAHVSAQKSDFAMCMGAQDSKPRLASASCLHCLGGEQVGLMATPLNQICDPFAFSPEITTWYQAIKILCNEVVKSYWKSNDKVTEEKNRGLDLAISVTGPLASKEFKEVVARKL
ncbi:hypothetical protein NC651_028235 [Populus alba x Populus x berolinensis]|nr:hypothetical protein NC651_028235 [Populus alba x Populus x berolinensis]